MLWKDFRRVHAPSDAGARYLAHSVLVKTTRRGEIEKRSFSKTLFKPEELENTDSAFQCG